LLIKLPQAICRHNKKPGGARPSWCAHFDRSARGGCPGHAAA